MPRTLHTIAKLGFLSLGALAPLACGGAPDSTESSSAATGEVSAALNACGAQYTVKAYNGGDIVQNHGANYQCKPYPFSGWCGIAGAYEPGVGSAWQDAWSSLGACGGSGTVPSPSPSPSPSPAPAPSPAPTPAATSSGSCTAWAAGTNYTTGAVVSFNGNAYIATHDNPGYDPTISTWFWSPDPGASCGGTSGGTTTGGTSSGGSSTCSAWAAGTNYTTGTVVSYNGSPYIATHDNPGYDPTISTWFWSPYTGSGCGSSGGGSSGGGTSSGGSTGTGKLAVKAGSVSAAYLPWLQRAAGECAFLDAPHLAAQIDQESRWDPNAVSSIGAQGLTQFLPGTWASFGGDANGDGSSNPFDPADAIVAQGRYMCYLVGQFGSNLSWTTLLWAYNAGPEATKAAGGVAPTAEAAQYADLIINQLLSKYTP